MRYFHLAAFSLLAACGSNKSDTESAPPVMQSMALDTEADLPACDESREHQLVYLLDTQVFMTCKAGTWTEIGATQAEAAESWSCTQSTEVAAADNSKINGLRAHITKFTNGSYFISCIDEFDGVGALDDATAGSRMYASNSGPVKLGLVYCEALYANFTFNIASVAGQWALNSDATKVANTACGINSI